MSLGFKSHEIKVELILFIGIEVRTATSSISTTSPDRVPYIVNQLFTSHSWIDVDIDIEITFTWSTRLIFDIESGNILSEVKSICITRYIISVKYIIDLIAQSLLTATHSTSVN